jgi:hypothetical protein
MKHAFLVLAVSLGCIFILSYTGITQTSSLEYRVSPLPEDNLIQNPWFRTGSKPSLDYWTEATLLDGGWGASQKPGNPTPDEVVGTAARISTGRGVERRGKSVDIGVDAYLYQVVSADPKKSTLKFNMYWVTHTVDPVEVIIYGGSSLDGPWTEVWKPFYQVHTKTIRPSSGRGQDMWKYYSEATDMMTVTLQTTGYPYYKLEIHGRLPDEQGGLKITGVYFAVE